MNETRGLRWVGGRDSLPGQRMRARASGWATRGLLLCGLLNVGCDDLHSCTDVGCGLTSAVVNVRRRAFWADGEYTLDVVVDGRQRRCRFALGPRGATSAVDCTPSLSSAPFGERVTIVPEGLPVTDDACPSGADGGRPPPCERRRYRVSVELETAAEQVALRLAFGEAVLLEQTSRLDYEEHQPNGPDCSPTCRQALLELEVPEP